MHAQPYISVHTCISVYIIKYTPAHTYTYNSSPPPPELEGARVPPYKRGSSATLIPKGAIHTHTYIYIYKYAHTYIIYTVMYTHIHIITCTYTRTYNTIIISSIQTNITSRYVALNYIAISEKNVCNIY